MGLPRLCLLGRCWPVLADGLVDRGICGDGDSDQAAWFGGIRLVPRHELPLEWSGGGRNIEKLILGQAPGHGVVEENGPAA